MVGYMCAGDAMVFAVGDGAVLPAPMVSGNKVSLAGLRSREKTAGRPPPWAGKKVKDSNRDVPTSSSGPSRGNPPVRPGDGRGSGSRGCHGSIMSTSSDGRNSGVGSDRRRDPGKKTMEEGTMRGDVAPSSNPKRAREEPSASLKKTEVHPLLLEGVNQGENVESFWDLNDFGIGLRKGMRVVGDHDMGHLIPRSFDTLTKSIALNSCQTLSAVRALLSRENKSREDEVKARRLLAKLKEDVCRLEAGDAKWRADVSRLEAENARLKEELGQLPQKLEVKVKEGDNLRKELSTLYEKHFLEVKTGGQFLASTEGEALKKSLKDEAVARYCSSPDFVEEVYRRAFHIRDEVVLDCRRILRETGSVSEDIVMMLYPQVPEVVDDLVVPPAGVLLDDIGDLEIIEALDSLPVDDTHDES